MKINAARNNSAKIWLHDDRRIKLPAFDFDWLLLVEFVALPSKDRQRNPIETGGWFVAWAGFVEAFSLESLREHKKEVL